MILPRDNSTTTGRRRMLLLMLLAAAVYFSANMNRLSLLPLDDCFYARKGVEMAERGAFFTVTWNDRPTFQNPPLQFWILGRSFALLGEHDLAARLPSLLMALGVAAMTWRIGRRTVGPAAALGGVGLLLASPVFLQNGRRCMMEMPTTFWETLALLVFVEAVLPTAAADRSPVRVRPAPWLLLLSVPVAAALLTKSVLGLLPVAVIVTAAAAVPAWRGLLHSVWLWLGLGLGLVVGAAWPLQQGLSLGWDSMASHYLGEIGSRVAADAGWSRRLWGVFVDYPLILLKEMQPAVLPGLVGAAFALRRSAAGEDRPGPLLLALWVLVPLLFFAFPEARSGRYLFPLLVPLSLLGAWLLAPVLPRLLKRGLGWLVVAALLVMGGLFWFSPRSMTRDVNAPFKAQGDLVAGMVPAGKDLPLLGAYRWDLANPLLYYGRRALGDGTEDVASAVAAARRLPRPVLVVERRHWPGLRAAEPGARRLCELRDWFLVELPEP